MKSVQELEIYLEERKVDFEIIKHPSPIFSVQDAKKYFDTNYAAPVFIVQTDQGMMSLIVSAKHGKLDFKELGAKLGFSKLKLADRKKAEMETGYKIGAMPLVGLRLPCIFDNNLLAYEYIYGGSGDELYTLKINPKDVKKLNNNVRTLN